MKRTLGERDGADTEAERRAEEDFAALAERQLVEQRVEHFRLSSLMDCLRFYRVWSKCKKTFPYWYMLRKLLS